MTLLPISLLLTVKQPLQAFLPCLYLHSMVLSVVVSNGLQERLCVIAESYSAGIKFGLIRSGCAQGAAVVFVLLLIVVVVDLTGLQTS